MAKIIDEKQTGKYRLLIIEGDLSIGNRNTITIDGIEFTTTVVYDLPGSVAIKYDEHIT